MQSPLPGDSQVEGCFQFRGTRSSLSSRDALPSYASPQSRRLSGLLPLHSEVLMAHRTRPLSFVSTADLTVYWPAHRWSHARTPAYPNRLCGDSSEPVAGAVEEVASAYGLWASWGYTGCSAWKLAPGTEVCPGLLQGSRSLCELRSLQTPHRAPLLSSGLRLACDLHLHAIHKHSIFLAMGHAPTHAPPRALTWSPHHSLILSMTLTQARP